MKTLKKISVLLPLLILCSGIYAQTCNLTINDENNDGGEYYDLGFEIWDYSSIPYLINTEYVYDEYFSDDGASVIVILDYQLAPDLARLKFHVGAQNTSTLKYGYGWSQSYFDSYDYYNNDPPVTVDVP